MRLFGIIIFLVLTANPLSYFLGIDPVRFVGLLGLLMGAALYMIQPRQKLYVGRVVDKGAFIGVLLALGTYAMSVFRTGIGDTTVVGNLNIVVQAVMICFLAYLFYSRYYGGTELLSKGAQAIFHLFWPLGLLAVVNVFGYFFGLTAPVPDDMPNSFSKHEHTSVIASLLGFDLARTGFFLTGHPNGFAILVGWGIVMGVLMLVIGNYEGWQKKFIYLAVGTQFFALLILDSRGTLASALVCILGAIVLSKSRLVPILRLVVLVVPLVSLSVTTILQAIEESGAVDDLSRGKGDFSSGNGRTIFWKYCVEELSDFQPEQVFGYGQNGHLTSGVAFKYEYYLGYPAYTHNFIYQTIFDMGYIGLASLLILMFIATNQAIRLYGKGFREIIVLAIFPVYFQLTGIFEATFGVFNQQYTLIFLLFTSASAILYNEFQKAKLQLQQSAAEPAPPRSVASQM